MQLVSSVKHTFNQYKTQQGDTWTQELTTNREKLTKAHKSYS